MSSSLVKALHEEFNSPQIDILVNDDTSSIAKLIPYVKNVYYFSYSKKKQNRWKQEKNLLSKIFKKYDLSINLTASDRSNIYALVAGKKTISAVEKESSKSWWKKLFLSHYYYFDSSKHILVNNLKPLEFLNIRCKNYHYPISPSKNAISVIKRKLERINVNEFLIFHASTQYSYKIYPKDLRIKLLKLLNNFGIPIIMTGGSEEIDQEIKKNIPSLSNIYDFIGETSFEEFFALSDLSIGYIGMDTINMHIAASQNKRIFAIFGPTLLSMWSPWCNKLAASAYKDMPMQTYGNITIFQADIACVACGKAGCDDNHGKSDCLDYINPADIASEVEAWIKKPDSKNNISLINKTQAKRRNILLYIVYGDDQIYYDGAIYSLLTFKNWFQINDEVEIVVLTEKPERFSGYPIKLFKMSGKQKNEWSLNNKYHFRIKNRGLAYIMDKLELKGADKILFLDTDTYFHKSPSSLFKCIKTSQAVFYLNEGLIYKRKRFSIYVDSLNGKKISINDETYELSKKSALWGSLMVGLTANMRQNIDWADKLMIKLFDMVSAHTIEEFSLSESLIREYNIVEGKKFVSLYSTSRKKEHARKVLSKFFEENKLLDIKDQIKLAQKVKIKRSIFVILKQRFSRIL
jgi:heptosyltransferase III